MVHAFRTEVGLGAYTTLKVGGTAQWFVEVETVAELQAGGLFAQQKGLPLFILGGGSNILARDEGFPGVVVHICIRGITTTVGEDDTVLVTAGAGEMLDQLVETAVGNGWWGIENLSHIPGTVGATPVQNVGAYGVEVADRLTELTAYNLQTGSLRIFTQAECQFAYRDSFFKTAAGKAWVITSVTFRLRTSPTPQLAYHDLAQVFAGSTPTLKDIRAAVIAIRAKKFPNWLVVGTAGSFFKNPIISNAEAMRLRTQYPELPLYEVDANHQKCALGYILDKICNLRGYKEGNVELFNQQALVLVAHDGATAKEIQQFAKKIAARVYEKVGITIDWEVSQL